MSSESKQIAQPIEGLDSRLKNWEKRQEKNRKEFIRMALLGAVVITALTFAICNVMNIPFGVPELVKSTAISAVLMLPPIVMRKINDRKPTQKDVDQDIALRNAFGMDSTVK